MKSMHLILIALCLLFGLPNFSEAHKLGTAEPAPITCGRVGKDRVHFGYVVGLGFNLVQAEADAEVKMWMEILEIVNDGWELTDLEILDEGPIGSMQYFIEFKATFTRK